VAPLLCAGLTVYKALKEGNLKAGEWITIIGAGGGLGSLAVQYAKALGYKVIGVDSSKKREYAKEKGVNEFVAFDEVSSVAETILNLTKGGSHAVLNVSNSVPAYNEAVKYLRPRGTLLLVGLPKGGSKIESDILMHTLRCINIKGSCVGNRADTREALEFFKDGLIDSNVKVVGLSQAADVFKLMEKGEILGRYVLDTSK
jgi:propanol-preferring alcohol dehydrogenase